MREYEVIWEIFNKCPNNQMRDVFVDEITIDDPEKFIQDKFKGKEVSYEKTVLEDGTIIFDMLPLKLNRDIPLQRYKRLLYKRSAKNNFLLKDS